MPGNNTYKLSYFDVRALAEPIRWIFHYAGVQFEDDRIPWDLMTWFAKTKKEYKSSVYQIPVLYVNGKEELCQSTAISRYLADQFGLLGDTAWERARGDEVISLVFDLFDAWRKHVFERDPARKATNQPILDDKFRTYFAKFNQLLEEKDGDFLNGSKLTHADFWLASYVSCWSTPWDGAPVGVPPFALDNSCLYPNLADEFPALKKHYQKVMSIPQIKKWIDVRPSSIL